MRPGVSASLAPRASSNSGLAPALLLDVQTPAGDQYFWADRPLANLACALTLPGEPQQLVTYQPWLLGAGSLSFYRSLQTDTLSLTIQNVSGDVLQSDWERIVRKATLEGSLFVFRYYAVDLAWAWIEVHGLLSVGNTSRTSAQLIGSQLLQGQDDTPVMQVSESCQLIWAQPRCGAKGATECLYTFASCQVTEHFTGIQTAFEINNPAANANVPTSTINRKRSW